MNRAKHSNQRTSAQYSKIKSLKETLKKSARKCLPITILKLSPGEVEYFVENGLKVTPTEQADFYSVSWDHYYTSKEAIQRFIEKHELPDDISFGEYLYYVYRKALIVKN